MKKKSFIMLLCAIMVMSSVAFGTIAYLTDREAVTNKFTIGNVDIKVDETDVDENGNPEYPSGTNPDGTPVNPDETPNRTEDGNTYPLVPGSEYDKDPTLTVVKGSKEAYVRMVVTITKAKELRDIFGELQLMYPGRFDNGFVPEKHVGGWSSTTWPCYAVTEDTLANTITLEFRYSGTVAGSDTMDIELPPLFTTLKVPGEITAAQLERIADLTIDVVGHAIQATGFADADAAWASFDAQTAAEAKLPAATATPVPMP